MVTKETGRQRIIEKEMMETPSPTSCPHAEITLESVEINARNILEIQ